MSVREDDQQNKNCPSRGLGLAAAAIGVGVGAALYYFFSKRPENPHEGGSTSTWECQQAEAFKSDEFDEEYQDNMSNDSYTTLSEHSTTDTSIFESPIRNNNCTYCHQETDDDDYETSYSSSSDLESIVSDDSEEPIVSETDNDVSDTNYGTMSEATIDTADSERELINSSVDVTEDTEMDVMDSTRSIVIVDSSASDASDREWDVINSSHDEQGHYMTVSPRILNIIGNMFEFSPRIRRRRRMREREQMLRAQALSEEEQLKCLRNEAFRERTWSLEECSICFEVILRDQEVMSLPCTHHFHTACILPWLQEQQTCPNCRTATE